MSIEFITENIMAIVLSSFWAGICFVSFYFYFKWTKETRDALDMEDAE